MDGDRSRENSAKTAAQREKEHREAVEERLKGEWAYIRDFIADEKDLQRKRERARKEREREERRRRYKHKKKESLVTFVVKELLG